MPPFYCALAAFGVPEFPFSLISFLRKELLVQKQIGGYIKDPGLASSVEPKSPILVIVGRNDWNDSLIDIKQDTKSNQSTF
jgi:hypothetical protein